MNKGFTLLELIIVIAIIGVLITVLLPPLIELYNDVIEKINNLTNQVNDLKGMLGG